MCRNLRVAPPRVGAYSNTVRPTSTALVCLLTGCTVVPDGGVFEADEQPPSPPAATGGVGSTGTADAPDDPPDDDSSVSDGTGTESGDVPEDPTDDAPDTTSDGSTGTLDPGDANACADDALEGGTTGSTLGRANDNTGSCGGEAAPDHAFVFTASEDGLYTFDTNGSDFDTVLYVLDGVECGAPELACDDDGGDSVQSEVSVVLDEGQSVTVVVDGYNANSGTFVLGTSAQTANGCGAQALAGALPLTAEASTAGASEYAGSCGGDSAPERAFAWTAPQAGTYTIHTTGSDFDTVLYVRDGSCVGPELDCDDDGGPSTQSSMSLTLQAGQEIVIFTDGYSSNAGNVVLTIE